MSSASGASPAVGCAMGGAFSFTGTGGTARNYTGGQLALTVEGATLT